MKVFLTYLRDKSFLKKIDANLFFVIGILLVIGLVNLYSTTYSLHYLKKSLFWQQFLWITLGLSIFLLVSFINYNLLKKIIYPLYFIHIIALSLIPFIGKSVYGAKRWIDLGVFHWQPSETIKMVIVLLLAWILSKKNFNKPLSFKNLILPLILISLPAGLILLQPDLGTAGLILFISVSMLFFKKIKKSVFITAIILTVASGLTLWNFGMKPYQKARVFSFISPEKDPRGAGYNTIQSRIAIGSGKLTGKGFKKGTQSQLGFLPERHTDFVFSVLSEEYGFIGSSLIIVLFIMILIMSLNIATQSRNLFGVFLCVGSSAYLFWHVFINLAMTMGLFPVVGVPLPLLSYGGSSMLTSLLLLGFVSSVACKRYVF